MMYLCIELWERWSFKKSFELHFTCHLLMIHLLFMMKLPTNYSSQSVCVCVCGCVCQSWCVNNTWWWRCIFLKT